MSKSKKTYQRKATSTSSTKRMPSLSPKQRKEIFVKQSEKLHLRFALEGEESTNFAYTLTLSSVTVSLLNINGTVVTPIKAAGEITADTDKPFYVQVNASITGPTPSGSLQLKFLPKDKDVWAAPQEFTFEPSGNGGLFLRDVKLP